MDMLHAAPQVHVSFYDVQGVFAYQLAPLHKMSLKFIHAGDAYTFDPKVNSSDSYTGKVRAGSGAIGSLSQSWHDSSRANAHYYSSMIALQSANVISSEVLLKSEVSCYDQRIQSVATFVFHKGYYCRTE